MSIEVLISTINANPKSLIKKMNLQTDAIIICQNNKFGYEEVNYKTKTIKIYYFNEKGVALSRDAALQRSTKDIILFADDDEEFIDGYEQIIKKEFAKNLNIDMFLFNLYKDTKPVFNNKEKRIHKFNCLKYGTVSIAAKRKKIVANNIHFCQLFGPGSIYGSGEDSIFIYDSLNKGLKLKSSEKCIATLLTSDSTWFDGYNEKYYFDKGALFRKLHGKNSSLFNLLYVLRHKKQGETLSLRQKLHIMENGKKEYSELM